MEKYLIVLLKEMKPYELRVNQFVKGFAEGLQLMKPGAKFKLFIPQELAYGADKRGSAINAIFSFNI